MLQVMRRGRPDEIRPLSIEEEARPDGADVVREHQSAHRGQWFVCDCRSNGGIAPVLGMWLRCMCAGMSRRHGRSTRFGATSTGTTPQYGDLYQRRVISTHVPSLAIRST